MNCETCGGELQQTAERSCATCEMRTENGSYCWLMDVEPATGGCASYFCVDCKKPSMEHRK